MLIYKGSGQVSIIDKVGTLKFSELDILLWQSRMSYFAKVGCPTLPKLDVLLCQSRTSYFPRVGRPTRYILTQYHISHVLLPPRSFT